ncbi:unnamed protein product [Schistocephalus solidus]|uniref:Uncharacterized protein n=1 Tax=Schistocephalus solidus TaxID=70667 RepID=A0A183TKJ5_SCHSO|nr:unnamed protein product [Schistocephalus solidus]
MFCSSHYPAECLSLRFLHTPATAAAERALMNDAKEVLLPPSAFARPSKKTPDDAARHPIFQNRNPSLSNGEFAARLEFRSPPTTLPKPITLDSLVDLRNSQQCTQASCQHENQCTKLAEKVGRLRADLSTAEANYRKATESLSALRAYVGSEACVGHRSQPNARDAQTRGEEVLSEAQVGHIWKTRTLICERPPTVVNTSEHNRLDNGLMARW